MLSLGGFVVRHDGRWEGGGGCGLGASDVFADKFEVSFGGGNGFWEVFAHEGTCQPWPSGVKRTIDGGGPGVEDWAVGTEVEPGG